MSIKYLNLSGLEDLWINIKNYILSKIPTKTSELTNDSGYLTSHQSLDNYVTLNSNQTITAIKTITGGNMGKMLFKNPNYTKGDAVESGTTISRLYFGNGASYATANGVLTTDINSAGNTSLELCAMENTANSSVRASLILTYDKSATSPRLLKSWGNFVPFSSDNYTLGNSSSIWKECYSNAYYLGTTAFGDIVTHNASEFLTTSGNETVTGTKIFNGDKIVITQGNGYRMVCNSDGGSSGYGVFQRVDGSSWYLMVTAQNDALGTWTSARPASMNLSTGILSINGNAATATQFSANTTVALTGDATGTSAGSKKGWSVPVTLANSGVTAGSYGPSANASPSHGGTFSVPYVTVDAKGRVTAASTITVTLPADSNTDTKVTQTVTTGNSTYPVLLCATANATATGTTTSRFSAGLTVNTRYSSIYMTNKYDTANTKGVRDSTKGYLNGDIIFRCYDASEMGRIHCESSKNGYQQTYMQARSYIKDGAISPEGTATTCYITVRVRDNGGKTIYTDGSWENSLTPYANETYNLGTSSLKWLNCYCKNFYGSYVDIAGKYIGNEASTNGRTCLYLKANRDTDGKSGIYVTKFRQNRAQGSLSGSDIMYLSYDILENEVRTNGALIQNYGDWSNSVPGTLTLYSGIGTRNLGSSSYPWTNAYINNLNLNGNAFDPASVSGNIGDIVFASAYYSSITGTASLDLTVSGNTLYLACFDNNTLVIDSSASSLPGTWKFLGRGKPTTTSGNADTKRVGLWKRIA